MVVGIEGRKDSMNPMIMRNLERGYPLYWPNRFNRRTSRARGLLFYRLLEQAVCIDPVSYKKMICGKTEGQ